MGHVTNAVGMSSIPTQTGYRSIAGDFLDDGYDAAYRIGKGGLYAAGSVVGGCLSVGIVALNAAVCVATKGLFNVTLGLGAFAYAPIKYGVRTTAHTYSVITPVCIQEPLNAVPGQLDRIAKGAASSRPIEILCAATSHIKNGGSVVLNSKPIQSGVVKPLGAAYSYAGAICSVVSRSAWEVAAAKILPISYQGKSDSIARKQKHESYPERQEVKDHQVSWKYPFAKYAPPYFDAPSVLEAEKKVGEAFMQSLSELRQEMPELQFEFTLEDFLLPGNRAIRESCLGSVTIDGGVPLNPRGRTGLAGRGVLPEWGPNYRGEPVLTRINPETGKLEALLVKDKAGKWTTPKGLGAVSESLNETVSRILEEELGVQVSCDEVIFLSAGYVEDRRNTDNAWIEKQQVQYHLSPEDARLYNQPSRKNSGWVAIEDLENVSRSAAEALSDIQIPIWL